MADEQRLARLVALHRLVLEGDAAAREQIASLLVSALCRRLRRLRPGVDGALVDECVHDGVLDYLRSPGRFDPSRSRLYTFVAMAARRNLIDRLRCLRRITGTEIPVGHPVPETIPFAAPVRQRTTLAVSRVTRSPEERVFLQARLDGEHSSAALAKLMGLDNLSIIEQRQAVKRLRDRLRRRLRHLRAERDS
jgi:hypothetical protein